MTSSIELTKRHRKCKILQIFFSNIALNSALTAASASTKHFSVKVSKYEEISPRYGHFLNFQNGGCCHLCYGTMSRFLPNLE